MREYNVKVLAWQYPVIRNFLFHYVSYRELHNNLLRLKGSKNFWTYTIDAHYLQAINNWCMVFGANSNDTHWRNLNFNNDVSFIGFKHYLLNEIGLSNEEWSNYWSEITNFRNKISAHREVNYKQPVPYLDTAYNVVIKYDIWIRESIKPDIIEFSIIQILEQYRKELKDTINFLLNTND